MHPYAHCSILPSGQDMDTTEVSLARGLGKEVVVRLYRGIALSRKERRSAAAWTAGPTLRISCEAN